MKRSLSLLPFLIMLAFLLLFPDTSFTCAASGLMLWFETLLPSLLPFMIISNLLIKTDLLKNWIRIPAGLWHRFFALSCDGAYALILGLVCGYPMGAKVTADLYLEKRISKKEAEYLLTFANHPGPSFLSSYVCLQALGQKALILPTYGIIYLANYLCCLLFRRRADRQAIAADSDDHAENKRNEKEISIQSPVGEILDTSIMNGFESITKLGGYIILFSVFQGVIKKVFAPLGPVMYLMCSITEMTTGITALAGTGWNLTILYPMLLGITAFGGICVAAQTKSMLAGTDLSFGPYIWAKLVNFLLTGLLAFLFIEIV